MAMRVLLGRLPKKQVYLLTTVHSGRLGAAVGTTSIIFPPTNVVPLRFHQTASTTEINIVPQHLCRPPSYMDWGRTSLVDRILRAAGNGNLQELKSLGKELRDGEQLANIKDQEGRGLLHVAAKHGSTNVCKYLLEELKFPVEEKDSEDSTPLVIACMKGHLKTAEFLIEYGANPRALQRHKTTPLHMATSAGNTEVMSLLLAQGVDVNAPSDLGTPLQKSEGRIHTVKLLLDHGADPNIFVSSVPTALQTAMFRGSLECTKLLIQAGADPNVIAMEHTPLEYAAQLGILEYVICLLDAGADSNIPNDIGLKPIESAAQRGHHRVVEILFPFTSPIPACSDWSISGIMKYVHSEGFTEQVKHRMFENYFKTKAQGEHALRRKKYWTASRYFTKAIMLIHDDATSFSKRSFCFACERYYDFALSDANACKMLKPDWPEAYLRTGVALSLLKDFDKAEDAFLIGLKLDPDNKELQNALQEVDEARRKAGPNPARGFSC